MFDFVFYFLYKTHIGATSVYPYFKPFIYNFGVGGPGGFEITIKCFPEPLPSLNVACGGRIGIRPIGIRYIPPAILPIFAINAKKRLRFSANHGLDSGNVIGLSDG